MGFNNGYDSGYSDAQRELGRRIKDLERQVTEGGGGSGSRTLEPVDITVPTGGAAALQNGALNKVSINATVERTGGWTDNADPDRPDPYWNGVEWVMDWDWYSDRAFSATELAEIHCVTSDYDATNVRYKAYINLSDSDTWTISSVDIASGETSGSIVAFRNGDQSDSAEFYVETDPEQSNLWYVSTPDYDEGNDGEWDRLPTIGDTFNVYSVVQTPVTLEFVQRQTIIHPPSGFKLQVPNGNNGELRDLQVLLTVNSTAMDGVYVKDIVQAPSGTTLVVDPSVKTGHVRSGSGESTLVTFRENTPGVVTVSTLNAAATAILPVTA